MLGIAAWRASMADGEASFRDRSVTAGIELRTEEAWREQFEQRERPLTKHYLNGVMGSGREFAGPNCFYKLDLGSGAVRERREREEECCDAKKHGSAYAYGFDGRRDQRIPHAAPRMARPFRAGLNDVCSKLSNLAGDLSDEARLCH